MGRALIVEAIRVRRSDNALRLGLTILFVMVMCLTTRSTLAQVQSMSFVKARAYQQTVSNIPPSVPTSRTVRMLVSTLSAADYSLVRVNSFDLLLTGSFWDFTQTYPDEISLDNDFPEGGAAQLSFFSGTQAGFFDFISIPLNNYPSPPPHLTGTTYDDLQGMDPTVANVITFNSADSVGGSIATIRIIEDPDGVNLDVFPAQNIATSDTSYVILADLLKSGTPYRIQIDFSTVTLAITPTMNIIYNQAFQSSTHINFTTGARNPDLNGDGIVDGADLGLLLGAWGTSP